MRRSRWERRGRCTRRWVCPKVNQRVVDARARDATRAEREQWRFFARGVGVAPPSRRSSRGAQFNGRRSRREPIHEHGRSQACTASASNSSGWRPTVRVRPHAPCMRGTPENVVGIVVLGISFEAPFHAARRSQRARRFGRAHDHPVTAVATGRAFSVDAAPMTFPNSMSTLKGVSVWCGFEKIRVGGG